MTKAVIERRFKKFHRGDGAAQHRLDEARADSLRLSEKLPEGPAWQYAWSDIKREASEGAHLPVVTPIPLVSACSIRRDFSLAT